MFLGFKHRSSPSIWMSRVRTTSSPRTSWAIQKARCFDWSYNYPLSVDRVVDKPASNWWLWAHSVKNWHEKKHCSCSMPTSLLNQPSQKSGQHAPGLVSGGVWRVLRRMPRFTQWNKVWVCKMGVSQKYGPISIWSNYSDLTRPHPNWWLSKGNPLIWGKPRLVKYYNLARSLWTIISPWVICWGSSKCESTSIDEDLLWEASSLSIIYLRRGEGSRVLLWGKWPHDGPTSVTRSERPPVHLHTVHGYDGVRRKGNYESSLRFLWRSKLGRR